MWLGEDYVFVWIGGEVKVGVGEEFFHFEEQFARSGVGADGGEITVGEVEGKVLLLHLKEVTDLVSELGFVTEVHIRDMNIEKIFNVAVLFRQAGEFWNGEGEAVDIWIMHQANLFHVGEGAFDRGGEEVIHGTGAVAVKDFAGSVAEFEFDGRVMAARPGMEDEGTGLAGRVRSWTCAHLPGDGV